MSDAAKLFSRHFGEASEAVVARAPGRVNLVGAHTDYNEGLVLSMIIDRHVEVVARRRPDRRVRIIAADTGERSEHDLDQPIDYSSFGWLPYVLGVVHELEQRRHIDFGVDVVFRGDVPIAAGLASSAALEVATAIAVDAVFNLWLNPVDMVTLAQEVENRYAGVRCGMMDQMASRLARPNHALFIDCRTAHGRHVPMDLEDHKIVIVDSGVRRKAVASGYNDRRSECEEAVGVLRKADPSLTALRDATPELLAECEPHLAPNLLARCRHVVAENQRVIEASERLAANDLPAVGSLMNASHLSLRNDYEVSHPAVDRLVEEALQVEGVLGARLTSAGFGGATVNLVTGDVVPELEQRLRPLLDDWSQQAFVVGSPIEAKVTEVVP